MDDVLRYLQKLKFELLGWIGCHPLLFRWLISLRGKNKYLLVEAATGLVIEGFPRSANNFATVAFMIVQNHPSKIAHHLHAPSQIIYSVQYRIPTLVLVRRPDDAILSLIIRESYISIAQALRAYIRFYTQVLPYLDKCVVASFEDVTTDFGKVIQRLNNRYGTDFVLFEHNEQNVKHCFDIIEETDKQSTKRSDVTETAVARPSSMRKEMKEYLSGRLGEEMVLLRRAFAVYEEVLAFADK